MKRKQVLLKPFNSAVFYNDKIFSIKNGHNVFAGIKSYLQRENIDISTIDRKVIADKYLYADVPYPWNIKAWLQILSTPRNKTILYCFESPLVNPFNHLSLFYKRFGKIYSWNDNLVKIDKTINKFNIPQVEVAHPVRLTDFAKRKFIVCINAKKNSIFLFRLLSPFKLDLYKERMRYIKLFENMPTVSFDLYGKGWTKPGKLNFYEMIFGVKAPSVYRGEISEDGKIQVLSQYKFCLCLENASAPGYITEKIFDCFIAGTVPLYRGAPNIAKYVPAEAFIDLNKFTDTELISFLENMTEKEYNKYLLAASRFVSLNETKENWSRMHFYKKVTRDILS